MKTTHYFGRLNIVAALIVLMIAGASATASESAFSDLQWLDNQDFVSGDEVSVVVFLDDDDSRNVVHRAASIPNLSRNDRLRQVTSVLKSYQHPAATTVASFLYSHSTTSVISHWIVPSYAATLTVADVRELAELDGVQLIVPNVHLENILPVERSAADRTVASASTQIDMLKVRSLWNRGLTGAGRLVCSFDTGVEYTHPALNSKWRGNHVPLSAAWMSTITPNTPPADRSGHGSHTMGIMVGSEGADTIGVAPGAEWITAGVIDQGKTLSATVSDILLAFQWALNPDGNAQTFDDVPDVILNSWGIPAGLFGPCDGTFWQAIDNVEAAGIVTIFAAGNEGPEPKTIRNPADRTSSPLNSFAVGAVDNNQVVASFSSRGPSLCDTTQVKPEVVAPGVSIRSATKGGGYVNMSGTSMAAPYIAGLAALCRQYNPDATVEEIKWALINSARDLGPVGEDNAYGHGLVDASRLPDFLPLPGIPNVSLASTRVMDGGIALPGKDFTLRVTLSNTGATVTRVNGFLSSIDTDVSVISNAASFYFGSNSTATNFEMFEVHLSDAVYHGETVPFTLTVEDEAGSSLGNFSFLLTAGYEPTGVVSDVATGAVTFTVTDFGQYGLAPGSIYNVNHNGFAFEDSNTLFEGGIIVGRSELQLSSSIRNADAEFVPSDFIAIEDLTEEWLDSDRGSCLKTRMSDIGSAISIPVEVTQETRSYTATGNDGYVIMRYFVHNSSLSNLSNLNFGFFADFDLSNGQDRIQYDAALDLVYQTGDSGPLVGIVGLRNVSQFTVKDNGAAKLGLTRADQYELISTSGAPDTSLRGDLFLVVGTETLLIPALDSVEVALALVAGRDLEELYARAVQARNQWDLPTDIDDNMTGLPETYVLEQNYPNPFNPTTTITFSLPQAASVSLDVFNVLGQRVRQLISADLPAGVQTLEWNGTDDSGADVASGVYFYRLSSETFSQSKKMVLLR